MSTVIAFSTARRPSARGQTGRRPPVEVTATGGAQIVILPVVRIERHDTVSAETSRIGSAASRPH